MCGARRSHCLVATIVLIVFNGFSLSYFNLNNTWQLTHVSGVVYRYSSHVSGVVYGYSGHTSDVVYRYFGQMIYNQSVATIYPMIDGHSRVSKSQTNESTTEQVQEMPHCTKERIHLVYLKIHKTASETLSAMVRRFGYTRSLSFILPYNKRNNLGWPYPLVPGMYRPNKTQTYDILCEHTVYDDITFPALMPPDTVFTASIRLPEYHFRSAFSYFRVAQIAKIPGENKIKEFLKDPHKWDMIYTSTKKDVHMCIPNHVSLLHNAQAFDLGFPMGFTTPQKKGTDHTNNATAVMEWLETIKKRFKFMIIVEYINESLILWRRYMCWSLPDIIYYTQNLATSPLIVNDDDAVTQAIRNFSSIDFALYEHYNKTLWANIEIEGSEFWDELDTFKYVMTNVTKFCSGETLRQNVLTFVKSKWHESFNYTVSDCKLLAKRLLPELRTRYERIKRTVPLIKPTGPAC